MICSCGAEAKEIRLTKDGELVDVGYLCDPCLARAHAGLALWRAQFDALLAAGCPRDKANDIIIARMNDEVAS